MVCENYVKLSLAPFLDCTGLVVDLKRIALYSMWDLFVESVNMLNILSGKYMEYKIPEAVKYNSFRDL